MKNHPEKDHFNIHKGCDCEHIEDTESTIEESACYQPTQHACCEEDVCCEENRCCEKDVCSKEHRCCEEEVCCEEHRCCREDVCSEENRCCEEHLCCEQHAYCEEHAYDEQEKEATPSMDSFKMDTDQTAEYITDQTIDQAIGQTMDQTTDQTIKKLQQELAVANDKNLRLYAEFDNFRKRNAQERLTLIETAGEKILGQILPIVDDFERALAVLRQKDVSVAAVEQGVELIHDKMMHLLEQAGVQVMKLEKGSQFDPGLHEAITKTPVSDASLQGKIVDIIEKGYLLKNKILRYAKVIIGE